MAILITGNSFGPTETVTSTKLNNIANSATFDTGAYDDATINLTGGKLQVKDGGIGYAKLSTGKPEWTEAGDVAISGILTVGGAVNATGAITTNSTLTASQGITTLGTAPATSTSTGTTGSIRWDNGFIYVCVATNTWKRVAIATWS